MTADILVTILAAIAFAVGITGIVLPILPGSILIIIGTLIWAIVVGEWTAWVAFGLITILSLAGITCSYVLTGRRLRDKEIPSWAILLAVIGGVIGMFLIPGPGLIIGFIIALYLVELQRRRDAKVAWDSTFTAIKALGIGILLELLCAVVSATIFVVAAALVFVF